MPKKITILVLIFVLGGIIFPLTSQAVAGIYSGYKDDNENGKVDTGELSNSISVCYEGFVPCGVKKPCWEGATVNNGRCDGGSSVNSGYGVPCTFCHFFVMLNGIIGYILVNIVPYLAVLMLVIGGVMYYFGGGKPELITKGKKVLIGVVIGLFLIYGSYMLVGIFLNILGATEWAGLSSWGQGFFIIDCPIAIP